MAEARDEADTPAAADPIRSAFASLFAAIIENTTPGSPSRTYAVTEALAAHQKIVAAMADRRVIH